jgi:hypothetical protein
LLGSIDAAANAMGMLIDMQLNERPYVVSIAATIFVPFTFITGFLADLPHDPVADSRRSYNKRAVICRCGSHFSTLPGQCALACSAAGTKPQTTR